MKSTRVKELMVPLDEYAVVSSSATLYDAVIALEQAQAGIFHQKHRHRAILVVDEAKTVLGKISMYDILISLEPKYDTIDQDDLLSRHGINGEFIKSMLKDQLLWSEPLRHLCSKATDLQVSNIMQALGEDVYIDEEASIGEAIHQVVLTKQQSLLVTRDGTVSGVLRLSDIFAQICEEIKACKI